jgi:hypothetical protein
MTTGDAARHALYSRLDEALGTAEADYLMTHLPRDSSDEVATKGDIERLEARFDRFEDRISVQIDHLNATIIDQQKFYARTTVWSMVGLTAIFSLVVTFFG